MKKLCKHIVTIVVSIILTIALLSSVVYADREDPFLSHTNTDHNKIMTGEDMNKYGESGTASGATNATRPVNSINNGTNKVPISNTHDRDTNLQSEQSSFIASQIAGIIKILPSIAQIIMSQCVNTAWGTEDLFTIQNLLMGKYDLFDINIFTTSSTVLGDQQEASFNKVMKESVSVWYSSIRNIAVVASLIVLLYTAIRMAMSTTVSDRVRYKKMLTSWFVGFALIFVLHYIALIMITISEQMVKVLTALAPTEQKPFEYAVMERLTYGKATSWNVVLQAILYFMLVWYEAKFFFLYLKRVISNAFLILIAPLVTVTYAIDKSNDCKAQAFNSWFEEMVTNVFIQPLHLLLFLVLLYSAGAIAELYPIIAILFMFGIGKAEKMLRSVFKLKGATIGDVEEGTTFTGLVSKM